MQTKILLALLAISIIGLSMFEPMPQNLAYHDFADKRTFFGIPNFWNVMSNLPMFFIGIYGLWQGFQNWSNRPDLVSRLIPLVMSFGIFITCFGSAYYHYAPDNGTLLWDRLPMTLMFMSLFSLLVYDFIGKKAGEWAFWLSIPFGVASVLYWHFTEAAGHGDLRPYALVQFFPMLAAPVLIFLKKEKVGYTRYIWLVLGWYAVAKLAEHFDKPIFEILGFWSGHTLKHLISGLALFYALKIFEKCKSH